MRKVLGILTEDFRLYHDLVAALKARDVPFVSLSFPRRVPESVGAVLTSPAEVRKIRSPHVVAVDDVDAAIVKALQLLKGKTEWRGLLIGGGPGRGARGGLPPGGGAPLRGGPEDAPRQGGPGSRGPRGPDEPRPHPEFPGPRRPAGGDCRR